MGEIGHQAHVWLDTMKEMGQSVWQMLPLGPTGYGNSPYQSLSSFAGNPLMLSFDSLVMDGALALDDLRSLPQFLDHKIDFGSVIEIRTAMLEKAAGQFLRQCESSPLLQRAFESFCEREADWLEDFALFVTLKQVHGGRPWSEWEQGLALRHPERMAEVLCTYQEELDRVKCLQFLFHRQWNKLRVKAKEVGISLVGDIPIFAAHDSSDVWANQHLFQLDEKGNPTVVAGVPPDYFSATGQRWGNPLYDWEKHQASDFAWWKARMRKTLSMVDIVRIDHFRAFAAYWEIPASEETAIQGRWVEAPGDALFNALKTELGTVPIVAEDLGLITPDVFALRDGHGFPGMKVMQFAFSADGVGEDHDPQYYPEYCMAYTGTHDNDTVLGLFRSEMTDHTTRSQDMIDAERRVILEYTQTDGQELNWDFIWHVWKSRANIAICPLQDVLGLGSESRMNVPGQSGEFWNWRFSWDQLNAAMKQRLTMITEHTGRHTAS